MSDSSLTLPAQPIGGENRDYSLSDDLAKLCLPYEYKDTYRKLAWVDSICFLFLVIGLIGLNAPKVIQRPLSTPDDSAPVIFTPPEEPPKPVEVKPEELEPPPDQTTEAPTVAPVAAVLDSSAVAFSVPVTGVVAIARSAAAAAPPPPPVKAPPPKPKVWGQGQGENGNFPWPRSYPREAQDQKLQGTVLLYVVVGTNGVPEKVEIKESSSYFVLDQFAQQWVKKNWKWQPGENRLWLVPFRFELK
jgi:TonB family protein